ncbi:ABC transporter permease [Streptomyces alanosinicus]|uniref:ABC transporter permease n=1 Tax=Streptomyces alanosinicus TaxID=68171 RepID=A0A918YF95_9ACTN|nr:ABC transporter permease [Streptomyces alanosinicus]GHE00887.1 ABC transporter permease [Streptomyces alanosinicus]
MARAAAPSVRRGKTASTGPPLVSAGLLLLLWWAAARAGVLGDGLVPTPWQTLKAAHAMWADGTLAADLRASLARAGQGFAYGATAGVALGFLTGHRPRVAALVSPVMSFLRPIPAIALVPLITAWFGIGEQAKHLVIAYAVFLAVWLYVHDGVARIPADYRRAARTLGVPAWRRLTEVLLPAAAPSVVTALRHGAGLAFLALVAAELGGAQSGIAYRLQVDGQFLRTDHMFVGIIELGLLGLAADALIALTGRRLIHWSTS